MLVRRRLWPWSLFEVRETCLGRRDPGTPQLCSGTYGRAPSKTQSAFFHVMSITWYRAESVSGPWKAPSCRLATQTLAGQCTVWYKQCKSRRCWEVKLFPREVFKDTLTTLTSDFPKLNPRP